MFLMVFYSSSAYLNFDLIFAEKHVILRCLWSWIPHGLLSATNSSAT